MRTILLVEDDPNLSESLSRYLSQDGYRVELAGSLSDAREKLTVGPALLVLDWMLPDGQGIDFLRQLRLERNSTPVILLTARTDLVDKILGLETGANDYVTKPFEARELAARIRVQLRSASEPQTPPRMLLTMGAISMDTIAREVKLGGAKVELTRMEYDLLKVLIENPGKVFSRDELLNRVWGYDSFPTTRTVDTHVLQLRQKFGDEHFETVRGVGYRLRKI